TVEGYFWDELGDYIGVSWWSRWFSLPAELAGRRLILQFESVRLRAEVFVNQRLVGYDAIGNTPFECDITHAVIPGHTNHLAIRVTDPSGNFTWVDTDVHKWGDQLIPASHGFGGVTGPVRLLILDAVHVADVFVRNTPSVYDIDVQTTVR